MSKVATIWQFSVPCIISKKFLLMKWAHFVGIICYWWRPYLNWQAGSLPNMMLLFFLSFLSLNSYLKDMKEKVLPLIVLLLFFCFSIAILSQEFWILISMIHFQKKFPEVKLPFIPTNIIISWVRNVSINKCHW